MNGKIYDEMAEQYKNASTAKEQRAVLFTMICTIGKNHLPHIEAKQRKTDKKMTKMFWLLIAVLLILVAQYPGTLQFIVRLWGMVF